MKSYTKKLLLAISMFLAIASFSYAQGPYRYGGYRESPRGGYGYGYSYGRGYSGAYSNTYFGFRFGWAISSVYSQADALDGQSPKSGIMAGVALGTPFYGPMDFETGLYYVGKGGKSTGTIGSKFTYNLDYLEVPFVIKYNYFISSVAALEPYFGGFASVGFAGQIKDYGERKAFSAYEDGYFRHCDAGLRIGCGLAMGNFYLDAGYDIGLANVGQDLFDNTRTSCFTLTCGVNF